jgi:hypothetical protein
LKSVFLTHFRGQYFGNVLRTRSVDIQRLQPAIRASNAGMVDNAWLQV